VASIAGPSVIGRGTENAIGTPRSRTTYNDSKSSPVTKNRSSAVPTIERAPTPPS
jgi:hypothetical protein